MLSLAAGAVIMRSVAFVPSIMIDAAVLRIEGEGDPAVVSSPNLTGLTVALEDSCSPQGHL
jgi:hypothetical protein